MVTGEPVPVAKSASDRSAPGKPGSLLLLRVTDAAFNVITFDLTGASRR